MSSEPPFDPDVVIRRITEAGRGVRLGKGVVGKTGHAVLGLLAIWGIVIWRLGPNLWLDGLLVLAGVAASAVFVWWTRSTQNFAERNPAQAMLEGAEFLEYQKFEAEAKGIKVLSRGDDGSTLIEGPKQ